MAFPDDHVALTSLFGSSAVNNSGTLSIDLSELPDVDNASSLTSTGIVLALIRAIQDNQGSDDDRKIMMPAAGPDTTLITVGGVSALREAYTINIRDDFASELDPDSV